MKVKQNSLNTVEHKNKWRKKNIDNNKQMNMNMNTKTEQICLKTFK